MLNDANFSSFSAVYLVTSYTDLRFGIDTLAGIVENKYHMHPFVPNQLFLFCGKNSSKIKGLLWEGDGYLPLYKRVENGHFVWPRNSSEVRKMTSEQFAWLMRVFSIDPVIKPVTPTFSA